MASAAILTAAGAAAIRLADKALDKAAERLTEYFKDQSEDVKIKLIAEFRIGFQSFVQASLERCRTFKTLLNPYNPLSVAENYIHSEVEIGDKKFSDETLVSGIRHNTRLIITGLAGGGKSMLMKYMTLKLPEHKLGFVPLFIELRRFNAEKVASLEDLILDAIRTDANPISSEQLHLGLKAGVFALVLDGFDELKDEVARRVEGEIIQFSSFHPRAAIIISSRPSQRFESWEQFYHARVLPLTKQRSKELITSFHYDNGVKERFLQRVEESLWGSHESFLSSPLLCTIMMLTFEEYAEIPTKMHAFYSQAFDTLFQRHDALKSQFNRETKTGLTRDLFKRCLSAFCATSYLDEKYSFSDGVAEKYGEAGIRYVRQSTSLPLRGVTGENFVSDLVQSVCVLQPDGTDLSFVHRTFQEYFASVFAVNYHDSRFSSLLDRFSERYSDSALLMTFDVAREKVESEWVQPRLSEKLDTYSQMSLNERTKDVYESIAFVRGKKGEVYVYAEFLKSHFGFYYALSKLYPRRFPITMWFSPIERVISKHVASSIDVPGSSKDHSNYKDWLSSDIGAGERHVFFANFKDDEEWIKTIGIASVTERFLASAPKLLTELRKREKSRESVIGQFF